MKKSSLKNFAIESRRVLMESVINRLKALGIESDKKIIEPTVTSDTVYINEKYYNKKQYNALIEKFNELKYEQLVESMAYTWFNRFVALRYMEVNGYISEKIIKSTTSKIEPDIADDFRNSDFYNDLSNSQKDELIELKDRDQIEELYSKLVIYKCNELYEIFPFMFEELGDYTDLLFPNALIKKDSFLEKLRENIKKDDAEEMEEDEIPLNIEIIGWLYQFYNAEKKDEVFAQLKKNRKLDKNTIPAATQLFTPKWIVKYMVENSLGKLVLENVDDLKKEKILQSKEKWDYYIEKINELPEKEEINIENVKFIDPAMGSGHILVYAFEMFYDIYEKLGYSNRDAIKNILENNLYGLEIDDRAGQIASFAILMKAREKYNRLFKYLKRQHIQLNSCAIQESNIIIEKQENNIITENKFNLKTLEIEKLDELKRMLETFKDAKEYGSIIDVNSFDIAILKQEMEKFINASGSGISDKQAERLKALTKQAEIMQNKYDVVVTNPPYMGGKGMGKKLGEYVKKNYKDSKSDLFAVFMEKCGEMTVENGYTAMIVMPSWLFLSSFEKLRKKIIENTKIESLLHMGRGIFGIDWGSVAFVLKNKFEEGEGVYFRLHKRNFQHIHYEDIGKIFLNAKDNPNFKYNFDNYREKGVELDSDSNLGDEK